MEINAISATLANTDDIIVAQRMEKQMKAEEKEKKLAEKARKKAEREATAGTNSAGEKGGFFKALFRKKERGVGGDEVGDDVIR